MEKASKADFKEAMRRAKIKEEVEKEMNESIIGDSAAAYFATDSQVDTDEPREPGRPKEDKAQPTAPKKRGRKPKTEPKTKDAPKEPMAAAQKKPGRKLKAAKPKQAAEQIAAKTTDDAIAKADRQESLRFLIGIARGRTQEIIRNAEAHIKSADKLADLAEIYDSHIRTVEDMLR